MALASTVHLAAALCEFLHSSHFYIILRNFALKTAEVGKEVCIRK